MKNPSVILHNVEKDDYNYNEAINTLRTNLQFCGNIKNIMVTSALPDEGKSDIAFTMAYSLAQIGKRVLLIDADIRKSVLITRYQAEHQVYGLSQYLSGQKKLDKVIYDVEGCENLSVIFAGPYSPNPVVLMEDELFAKIFEDMGELYDYIIVDTPPMGAVIDGAIVARHCDGAVLVIESGVISYRLEQKVKAQIEMSGCRILGAVLNKVDKKSHGYGKYGKYGKYGSYGKYDRYEKYGMDEYQKVNYETEEAAVSVMEMEEERSEAEN